MTSERGIEIIQSGWRASGILDTLRIGSSALPSIDPFTDIDPAPMPDDDEPNVGTQWANTLTEIFPKTIVMMIMMRTSILMQQEKVYLIF